jgi:replicative DNA helicase
MIEHTVLANLLHNEPFCRKVVPYIKDEYFEDAVAKSVFTSFSEYINKYKAPPTVEALRVMLDDRKDLNEDSFKNAIMLLEQLQVDPKTNQEWLVDETEKFCRDRDIVNSIRRAILIIDGKDSQNDRGTIPKLLSDSLSINFDTHIGHDYTEDFEERFAFYHKTEQRIPFDIEILNKITKGGLPRKSLSVFLASTGVGKSLVMCHMAASAFMRGKNVLYITAEMAEERIAERIDANLLNVTVDELREMPRDTFERRVNKLKSKTIGRLVVKEYPTGSAHAGHFRHLLNELRLKKTFVPDIIFIDYLNICCSSRVKGAAAGNTYLLVKSIAEEIRGLAMEFDVPIVSATQANRDGYGNTDMDLTNTSESIGLPATVDFMAALISSEELESLGQLMFKQLKNRWGDINHFRRFVVGVERPKMRLFELEDHVQSSVSNEPQQTGREMRGNKKAKPSFDGFM